MFINNGEGVKREIVKLVKQHPQGLTITELAKKIGIHRQTVTKYVLELKGSGVILRRHVGSASLHYLTEDYREVWRDDLR